MKQGPAKDPQPGLESLAILREDMATVTWDGLVLLRKSQACGLKIYQGPGSGWGPFLGNTPVASPHCQHSQEES